MAKVLLLDSPSWRLFNPGLHCHLGILYLAGSLRAAGHDVKVLDCHKVTGWDGQNLILHKELMEPCDVLGISATTANVNWGAEMAAEWPAKVKVLGGTHVTHIMEGPHERFKQKRYFPGFDFLMYGECEDAFVEFVEAVGSISDPRQCAIPGLVWFDALGRHQMPPPKSPDVTVLPGPAFDLWESGFAAGGISSASVRGRSLNANDMMTASLYTARGCLGAGTPIMLKSGVQVPIEALNVGDVVSCFDTKSGEFASASVQATWERDASDLWEMSLDGGEILQITGEHPAWTQRGWVNVEDLEVGDHLLSAVLEGAHHLDSPSEVNAPHATPHADTHVWKQVVSKRFVGPSKVFNITVHPYHNYFANGLLVHNCPYGCHFCADARTKLREETIEQIERQVAQLAAIGVRAVRLQDDTFTIREERCRQIADVLDAYGMKWRACTRVNLRNGKLFEYMAAHGCTELAFGIEHGSARMLKAMNKGTTPEANEVGLKMAQDAGIIARAYLMIGFPGETDESVDELEEWVLRVRPDAVILSLFQPFPGSDVWNHPENYGVTLPDGAFDKFWQLGGDNDPEMMVLTLPTISKAGLFAHKQRLVKVFEREIGALDRTQVLGNAGNYGPVEAHA